MDPRFDGSDLGRGDRRDLLIREAFDIPEEQGNTLVGRNDRKSVLDDPQCFATGCDVNELRAWRQRFSPAG